MRPSLVVCSFGLLSLLILSIASSADAHTTKGDAFILNQGGAGALRCIYLTRIGVEPNCDGGEPDGNWEQDAASCVSLFYFDITNGGALAPDAPNKVTLQVYADDTASVVKTYQTLGADPANGATFTFCATSNGDAGGIPRAGIFRAFIRAVKDNGPGGVGNYDLNSDTQGHKGTLRAKQIVDSLTSNAAPSGSIFAYGTAGDETNTLTATYKQPIMDNNAENVQLCVRRTVAATDLVCQTATDTDSTAATFNNVVDLTFDAASTSYGAKFTISGNGVLNAGFAGNDALWTIFATTGHGTGVVRDSDTQVHKDSLFTADPRITVDKNGIAPSDGDWTITANTLWNRGETITYTGSLLNARDQVLTRSMTIDFRSGAVSAGTVVDTGNPYTGTFTIPTTAPATADSTGAAYFIRVTNTDQTKDSDADQFRVSSLYRTHPHTQLQDPLVTDDPINGPFTHDEQFVISVDTVHLFCHVRGVRNQNIDTGTNQVTVSILNPSGGTIGTANVETTGTGWTDLAPPGSHLDMAAVAPSGIWTARCAATHNGNTGTADLSINFVSAFTANLNIRIIVDPTMNSDGTYSIFIRTEDNGLPLVPERLPNATISYVNQTADPWAWQDDVLNEDALNVVTFTPNINGALYVFNWTAPADAPFRDGKLGINVRARSVLNGAPIMVSESAEVSQMFEIEGKTAPQLLEFLWWSGWFVFGLSRGSWFAWFPTLAGMSRLWIPAWAAAFPFVVALMLFVAILTVEAVFVSRTMLHPFRGLLSGRGHAEGGEP